MQVALCQLNSTVGDISGNASRMMAWYHEAAEMGADLVVFPELALTGYPPRDLFELDDFIPAVEEAIENLAASTGDTGIVFGTQLPNPKLKGVRHSA